MTKSKFSILNNSGYTEGRPKEIEDNEKTIEPMLPTGIEIEPDDAKHKPPTFEPGEVEPLTPPWVRLCDGCDD